MKKYVEFNGLDALQVALASSRNAEIEMDGRWVESQSYRVKPVASREPQRVRLKGYAKSLVESIISASLPPGDLEAMVATEIATMKDPHARAALELILAKL